MVGSDIVPVDGVGRISYDHCLYRASPFCSITCILFHQSIFIHLILYLLFPCCFGLPLLLLISNFKAFIITFSSSFLKTDRFWNAFGMMILNWYDGQLYFFSFFFFRFFLPWHNSAGPVHYSYYYKRQHYGIMICSC